MTVKDLIKKLESVEDHNASVIMSLEVGKILLEDKTEEMIQDKGQEVCFSAEVLELERWNGDFVLIEGSI